MGSTTLAAARTAPGSTLRGIALMVTAVWLFGAMDAGAKYLSAEYPVFQIVWARYFFHAVLLTGITATPRPGRLVDRMRTSRPWLQVGRSGLLLAGTLSFFTALRYIPLADAAAISFVSPLMVAALSVPLLGERVGWRRWAAIGVGFLGVLVILRPGVAAIHWAATLPLLMAFFFACYQIATRVLSRTDAVGTTNLYTSLVGAAVTTALVPLVWETPDATGWLMMAGLGLLGGTGHFLLIRAYGMAPASTLAPFVYTQLLFATALGYFVFGDVPDAGVVVGGLIVVASGIYLLHRESRTRREG